VDRSNQSLIAVSYEARARGVKRIMLGDQARAVCPEIVLVQVCIAHKKADLAIYREAGAKTIKILARYGPTERASIDEAYVDLTAAAQAKLKEFGPEMIARARKQSKLAGLEGQEQQALSREDVRNGVLVGGGGGGGEGGKEEKVKEDKETKTLLLPTTNTESNGGDASNDNGDTKPAPPDTTTTSTSTGGEHDHQQPSSSTISGNETRTIDNPDEQQQQQQQRPESPSSSPSPSRPSTTRAAAAWWDRPLHAWTRSEKEMVCGATILSDMRAAVTAELGYTCSGGLAPSKLLAKLGSAMHKPNQQTLIVQEMVPFLLAPLAVARLKGLGGDFGKKVMEDLGCSTIGEVVQTPLARLQALYGDSDADWLFKLVRGVDGDTVEGGKGGRERGRAGGWGCCILTNLKVMERKAHILIIILSHFPSFRSASGQVRVVRQDILWPQQSAVHGAGPHMAAAARRRTHRAPSKGRTFTRPYPSAADGVFPGDGPGRAAAECLTLRALAVVDRAASVGGGGSRRGGQQCCWCWWWWGRARVFGGAGAELGEEVAQAAGGRNAAPLGRPPRSLPSHALFDSGQFLRDQAKEPHDFLLYQGRPRFGSILDLRCC